MKKNGNKELFMRTVVIVVMLGVGPYSAFAADEIRPVPNLLSEKISKFGAEQKRKNDVVRAKIKSIQDKIAPLNAQLKEAKDGTTTNSILAQIQALQAEMAPYNEEMIAIQIEGLEQRVEFDKERLEEMRGRLTKMQEYNQRSKGSKTPSTKVQEKI